MICISNNLYNPSLLCSRFLSRMISSIQVDKDFAFSLFELDWDVFSFNIEGAINRVPVIENTGVKSTVCGPGT